jgi:hypothetical protein
MYAYEVCWSADVKSRWVILVRSTSVAHAVLTTAMSAVLRMPVLAYRLQAATRCSARLHSVRGFRNSTRTFALPNHLVVGMPGESVALPSVVMRSIANPICTPANQCLYFVFLHCISLLIDSALANDGARQHWKMEQASWRCYCSW